jgi:hypothetical protein
MNVFILGSRELGTNEGHLVDLFKPTELEEQYSKLESKAKRHGERVVIWVKCSTCGMVGEWQYGR